MIKITVSLPNPATSAASYTGIELGRASSEDDANSRSGTFVSIGQIATIDAKVGVYTYVDSTAPAGVWYSYRLTGSPSNSGWSASFQGKALGYILPSDLREYELGSLTMPDGTDSTDGRLERLIGIASTMVDGYCGFSFEYRQSTEHHMWSQETRRIYPYSRPIVSVSSLEVFVSNQQKATFNLSDFYINSTQNYVEVTSLANVTYSLFPAIVALGLIQPVALITYTHGYQNTPQPIKDATALIAIDLAARDALYQSGMGQLTKLTVGDTTMERLPQSVPGKQSSLAIPPTAAAILDQYVAVSLR
jgi:hypothetical protein